MVKKFNSETSTLDFDLYQYLTNHRTDFLHTVKGYADGLNAGKSEDPCGGVGDCAVEIMNTYFILQFLEINPPQSSASRTHKELVGCMKEVTDITLDENRFEADLRTGNGRIVPLLDTMISKYDCLIEILKPERDR
jgi:hypothetical protein